MGVVVGMERRGRKMAEENIDEGNQAGSNMKSCCQMIDERRR